MPTNEVQTSPSEQENALWAAAGGLEADYLAGSGPGSLLHPRATRSTAASPAPGEIAPTVRPPDLPQEVRALWVTRWDFQGPGDVRRITDQAAQANFNVLLFQVRGNADAYYRSRLEPWATRLSGQLGQDPGWDPLQLAIEEAHRRGLELHAWLNVYPAWLGKEPPGPAQPEPMLSRFNRLYGDAWVMWDRNRQPMALNDNYLWANPGHWAVIEHITGVCQDLISRYYVDGIHLDNVRYAGWEFSTDPLTMDRLAWAQQLQTGLTRQAWQRQQVDHLVASLYDVIDELKPGLLLSAAVWPVYKDTWDWWSGGDGFDGFCQDSVGWLRAGIMDAILPMLYLSTITQEDDQYELLVQDFVERSRPSPVYAGITATYGTFDPIGRRIDLARQAGTAGQALFSYSHVQRHNYWDELRAGPYRTPAIVLPPLAARQRLSDRLQQHTGSGD